MAATLTQERFEGPEWIFERKLDGIRLIAFRDGDEIRLYSRNRLPQDLPAIRSAIAALRVSSVILDGEMTWGHADVQYHVFDIMWLNGRSLTTLPLTERLPQLRAIRFAPPLHHVEPLDEPRPWERACREGWEGVIAKR